MEKYRVYGGHRLVGDVEISGAKNAVVAILPAVILADGVCRIENIPNIMDVATSLEILSSIGAQVRRLNKNTVEIDPRPISTHVVPHDLARHMRASYYFIGALLGRFGTCLLYTSDRRRRGCRPSGNAPVRIPASPCLQRAPAPWRSGKIGRAHV